MISNRLQTLFTLALLLVAAHGVEEVSTGFMYHDGFVNYFANIIDTKEELFYWSFHIMWWLMLVVAWILIVGKKLIFVPLTLFGIVFFFEIHHLIKGLLSGGYYSGMITAFFYPILGFFYWKELLKNWRKLY